MIPKLQSTFILKKIRLIFFTFKLLGHETSRQGPATAPGPPTPDWGGTDAREKKKNAFFASSCVRKSGLHNNKSLLVWDELFGVAPFFIEHS